MKMMWRTMRNGYLVMKCIQEAAESEKWVHCTEWGHEECAGDVQNRYVCDSCLQ
jgi:hypothetical protein